MCLERGIVLEWVQQLFVQRKDFSPPARPPATVNLSSFNCLERSSLVINIATTSQYLED